MRFCNLKRLEMDEHLLIIGCAPGFRIDVRIPLDLVCHCNNDNGRRSISAPYVESLRDEESVEDWGNCHTQVR
jgi:hypothetical protein